MQNYNAYVSLKEFYEWKYERKTLIYVNLITNKIIKFVFTFKSHLFSYFISSLPLFAMFSSNAVSFLRIFFKSPSSSYLKVSI